MRSKNASKNLIISLFYELLIFALGIIVPRYIIISYGDAVNGLTQTINRLLTLINLIQAGAVGASIYQMYKPVADNDYETQSAILYSSKKFFKKIGIIYLCIAFALSIFYGFYLEGELKFLEIVLSFAVLATNGSLYFFFTTRFDIFLSPHQKKYLLTLGNMIERVLYYALLFVVIFTKLHFIFMYVALLVAGIIRVLINGSFYLKHTKGKIVKEPKDKNFVIKDRKYLIYTSIGNEAITASPTVIITTFISLAKASVFSVYSMLYTSMKTLLKTVQLSVSPIFGNLVASSNDEKIAKVYNVLQYIFLMVGVVLSSCIAFLIMPFLKIYTVGFENAQDYISSILAIFVIGYVVLFSIRNSMGYVSTVYGLFKVTYKITLTSGIIGVVISLVCTLLFGFEYVMTGVLAYNLMYIVRNMIILKQRVSWFKYGKLFQRIALILIVTIVSYLLYAFNVFGVASVNSFIGWLLYAICFGVAILVLVLIYSLIFERKEFFALIDYAKAMLKRKGKKKNA